MLRLVYPTPRRGGFTLVEVVVTAAIVGLIAVIAFPNFVKARNSGRVKTCITNLRALEAAKSQWALEFQQGNGAVPTQADVRPYLRFSQMPSCPGDGTYRLRRIERTPTCTLWNQGHTLRNQNADDDALPD